MADEFGTLYTGLKGNDYDALFALGNTTLNTWLEANMKVENASFGKFYIYVGDGNEDSEYELLETLEEIGFEYTEMVTTFVYLKSTWRIEGF